MKKCYLDANFLLYITNEKSPQYASAFKKLHHLVTNTIEIYISPLVIDEFLHSALFLLKGSKELSASFDLRKKLQELLGLPGLSIVNPPLDKDSQFLVLDFIKKYRIGVRDAYHLLIMHSNSIDAFATFDTDFKKVFSAKLLSRL